jgi:tetratricopeptide (TPR) repeat protein
MGNLSSNNEGTASITPWQIAAMICAVITLLTPFIYLQRSDHSIAPPENKKTHFVGSENCQSCHSAVYEKWMGSHHDLAMDRATEDTVLGDFNDAQFTDSHNNVTSRFYRKDSKFYVDTEGPDGNQGSFEITHTFGAYPLQQYLIPFPGGRLQCLNIAWDVAQQKWYRVPPYEVDGASDWLHWTKGAQTWNGMCAECHSTRLVKDFSIKTESYTTSWFEINVGCEACHGPGSGHVEWANRPAMGRPQDVGYDLLVQTNSIPNTDQIAICAPCHSRRFQLGDNDHQGGELLDLMVPSLLNEGLYYPDGQILEEVYVYGSFAQSKMYQHGVSCSDCHDMHSLNLNKKGNGLCLQCHRASDYDTPDHHFHKREYKGEPSDGHLCVKCHMPGRLYMGIDYRPDHSLRIPRPDLSSSLGVPNSCSTSDCHADKGLPWVQESYSKWYGTTKKAHYGEIFAAARNGDSGAGNGLKNIAEDSLLPAIVRATALTHLADYRNIDITPIFSAALQNDNALLRYTAIRNLDHLDDATKVSMIQPKLYDPVKAVRIEAARSLASIPIELIREEDREVFEQELQEYRQAMLYNSDFAPQRYNLGNLEVVLGNHDKATEYYKQALAIDTQFFPAKVNLAMQLNASGEKEQAAKLLREVIEDNPELYEVSYSLGLLLGETGDYAGAATYLGKAADGMPEYSRAQYNYALSLLKLERWEEGAGAIQKALIIEPANEEYFTTLANLYLNFNMRDRAESLARQTLKQFPSHGQARKLLDTLP